jgi:hypothetical protein
VLGDDSKFIFWVYAWLDGQSIPQVDHVATVSKRHRSSRSVASALGSNNWWQDITSPRTVPVLVQYVLVRERVEQVVLLPRVEDHLQWRWTTSGKYTASSTYTAMFLGQTMVLGTRDFGKSEL